MACAKSERNNKYGRRSRHQRLTQSSSIASIPLLSSSRLSACHQRVHRDEDSLGPAHYFKTHSSRPIEKVTQVYPLSQDLPRVEACRKLRKFSSLDLAPLVRRQHIPAAHILHLYTIPAIFRICGFDRSETIIFETKPFHTHLYFRFL
jgi:hypothetical protein